MTQVHLFFFNIFQLPLLVIVSLILHLCVTYDEQHVINTCNPYTCNNLNRDSFKDIETIQRSANDRPRDLRMPVYFFNVLLALVDEE